MWALIST